MESFNEGYAFPVCIALLRSELQAEKLAIDLESKGQALDIPDEYRLFENARLAHAVMTALALEQTSSNQFIRYRRRGN